MINHKLNIVLLFLFFIVGFVKAQGDSLSIVPFQFSQNNTLINKFEKQINTYTLQNFVKYGSSFSQFSFGVFNQFNSTLIKTQNKSIKDENKFSAFVNYSYSPKLSFGILLNSLIFEDDRNVSINNTSRLETIFFSNYNLADKMSFIPFAGLTSNELVGIKDDGYLYGSELMVNHLLIEDFDILSNFRFQNEDILPRKNIVRLANIEIKNSSENIRNTIRAYFNQNGKDFYVSADSSILQNFDIAKNIQNRNEKLYFVQDNLQYIPLGSNLSFDLSSSVSLREVSKTNRYYSESSSDDSNFDTKLEEFGLNFTLGARYTSEDLSSAINFTFQEKEEKYNVLRDKEYLYSLLEERQEIENKKNNKSQIITLSLLGNYNLSKSDILSFSSFIRKLKYDTSSELNFDDRDEILSIVRLMYLRKINPFLNAYINIEGSFNHLVYIFSERSANNNKRRILKLTTGTDYKGKRISSKNSFEVSANYTTYDFEDLVPNFRSFSFRQFVARDSTSISFSKNTGSSIIGTLKLSEQGDFNWTDFASKPIRYIKELHLEPKLFYKLKFLKFAIGMKYFLLDTYSYKGNTKILNSSYQSIGPLGEIVIQTAPNLYFKVISWYEFIKRENSNSNELINMNLELNWIL